MSILAVGSIAFDSIKTPFGERDRVLGGAATYFSLAASFFTDVKVVAVVGGDFNHECERIFLERQIDISEIERIPEGKTFYYSGEYGYDLNVRRTLDTQLNVFANFKPRLSDASRHLPYLFLGNIAPEIQLSVRKQMRNPKLVAMDTMNYWIERTHHSLLEALREIDILIINDSEARELAGEANLIKAARRILTFGPHMIVVKRGEYGAAMFTSDSYFATPAFPLEDVFDPTGAGDGFAGGFMGYLAGTGNMDESALRRAIIYGSVMASFVVEEFGCDRLRRLTYGEIGARFKEFKAITHFEDIEFVHRAL